MALSIFKKPAAQSARTIGAAQARLDANRHEITALRAKLQSIHARDEIPRRAAQAALDAAAPVQRIRAEIDQLRSDAMRADQPAPDVTANERALTDAEKQQSQAEDIARAAATLRTENAENIRTLNAKTVALSQTTPRLLHEALVESIEECRAEFDAAEAALRTVHFKAFVAARAADRLSEAERYGVFEGSGRFYDLQISRPATLSPVFEDDFARGRALEAAHAKLREDGKAIEKAADVLVDRLLNHESAS